MYPTDQPDENVALQGRDDLFPGQPAVQFTTVNIISEPPNDHIIWSLCCFVNSNLCCLGLAALVFSIKARDRKLVGDLEGAQHYGSTARCLNIWATVLCSVMVFIGFIVMIIVFPQFIELIRYYRSHSSNSYNINFSG